MKNGQKAKTLWWTETKMLVEPQEGEEFLYHSEYFGDHTENWILVIRGGKEIQRHNVAHITSIEWEADNDET